MNNPLRIIFLGTPDFAVASLDILVKNNCNIVGVVTAPDKPAGRGQKLQQSAVKEYAVQNNLKILQPEKLKDPDFIDELRALNADLQIVVAFRMLPEIVWNMPRFGTFNLHGSLLPQYRGAAPINWAVINGEKETGVTTFFLQHQIDTGKIIFNEKTPIGENETAGEVHDRLMEIGAGLVLKTVQAIDSGDYPQTDQDESIELKHAPKIFKEDGKINWKKDIDSIHNHIRGLSPYPTAWTELKSPSGELLNLKIFRTEKEINASVKHSRDLKTDGKKTLKIGVDGGYISLLELQLAGKKRMTTEEFLRGFKAEGWEIPDADEERYKVVASQLRKPHGEGAQMVLKKMSDGNAIMYENTIKELDLQPNDTILEIGMANGFFVKDIFAKEPSVKYTGCDFSEDMVKEAAQQNEQFVSSAQAKFVLTNGENLPFEEATFDKVFTVNTLYFWKNQTAVFSELKRVLKPYGKLIIAIRPKSTMVEYPFTKYGFNMFTKEELVELLSKNDLSVETIREIQEPIREVEGHRINVESIVAVIRKK